MCKLPLKKFIKTATVRDYNINIYQKPKSSVVWVGET